MTDHKYPIVEIFESIQGEGCNMGRMANFVRFAGCNLNCPWCDTVWNVPKSLLTVDQIIEHINFDLPMIVFTGGEPFLQNLKPILEGIRKINKEILIAFETNGTMSTEVLEDISNTWVACSPKPEKNWKINPNCKYNELKYVIDDNITINDINDNTDNFIWLQPQGYDMQNSWKKCMDFAKQNTKLRVGVQLHKIMEVR